MYAIRSYYVHDLLAHQGAVLSLPLLLQGLAAQVGGHDDQGVAEVDGPSVAVTAPLLV